MSRRPHRAENPSAAAPKLPPLATANVAAGALCYRESPGPAGASAVVLLHGVLATSGLNWMHAFEPLGRHFRVVAPDLCGHGATAAARRPFTLEHCADEVAELIAGLRLKRPIVVGYSMGGMVLSGVDWGSRQYGRASTLLYPAVTEAILRLVHLHACLLRAPTTLLRRLTPGAGAGTGRDPLGAAASELIGHDPTAIAGAVREITLFRSIDWLHEIDVPTTVLVTRRDTLFPRAEQRRMAKAIASARVREFDGGHVSARLPAYAGTLLSVCLDLNARMATHGR